MLLVAYAFTASGNIMRSEQELETLRSGILKLQQKLDQDRRAENNLELEIEKLERKSTELESDRKKQQLALRNLKVEKKRLETQLSQLRIKRDAALENISTLVHTNFMIARQDSMRFILKDNSPSQASKNLILSRYLIQAYDQELNRIKNMQVSFQQTLADVYVRQEHIDLVLGKIDKIKSELSVVGSTRQAKLSQIRQELSNNQNQVVKFQQKEKDLELLLESLKSAKTRQPVKNSADKTNISVIDNKTQFIENPDAVSDSTGFLQNKGKLAMPVKARVLKQFGEMRTAADLSWKGIMFDVKEGEQVSAIYRGQVVFSGWFGGYGQLLVLDHGDGYMSLYGHNQQLYVQLGSLVETGQKIATAGATGGLADAALYFEVRYYGEPDDPLKWCRL